MFRNSSCGLVNKHCCYCVQGLPVIRTLGNLWVHCAQLRLTSEKPTLLLYRTSLPVCSTRILRKKPLPVPAIPINWEKLVIWPRAWLPFRWKTIENWLGKWKCLVRQHIDLGGILVENNAICFMKPLLIENRLLWYRKKLKKQVLTTDYLQMPCWHMCCRGGSAVVSFGFIPSRWHESVAYKQICHLS